MDQNRCNKPSSVMILSLCSVIKSRNSTSRGVFILYIAVNNFWKPILNELSFLNKWGCTSLISDWILCKIFVTRYRNSAPLANIERTDMRFHRLPMDFRFFCYFSTISCFLFFYFLFLVWLLLDHISKSLRSNKSWIYTGSWCMDWTF